LHERYEGTKGTPRRRLRDFVVFVINARRRVQRDGESISAGSPFMFRISLCIVLFVLGVAPQAAGQSTIFVVRHAERADAGSAGTAMMKDDPDLSPAGVQRAKTLATMLRDAEIKAIYTTELKRTRQTAAPLVTAVGIPLTSLPQGDVTTLLQKVKGETGNILIIGHSNTVPTILEGLGVSGAVTIKDDEYDNLFVVLPGTPARFLRLRIP
jgi:phosphohistidine phosphatase SixA